MLMKNTSLVLSLMVFKNLYLVLPFSALITASHYSNIVSSQQSVFSVGEVQYESKSDSGIDYDLIRALLDDAKQLKEAGDLSGAEDVLKRSLENSLQPTLDRFSYDNFKTDVVDLITEVDCPSDSREAKMAMMSKLQIIERQVGRKNERFLGTLSK